MALTLQEQIKDTLSDSRNILITFKKNHDADTVSSALALKLLLEKLDKNVDIVSDAFSPDETYTFLPQSNCIQTSLEGVKNFKICLDLRENPLKDFSYDVIDDQLHIFLTPKKGMFSNKHVKTEEGSYRYDLIITVDTEDLESLGEIFDKHPDFFYETTIINIDHKPENEKFGQINNVNPNVTSTAELVYELLELVDENGTLIDEHIAQCLLCGIIAKTHSFKSNKVTPVTLHIASRLMKAGADRDHIIKNLYYTKSISTLKLWGKVLARLKSDPNTKLAWSYIKQQDFEDLNAKPIKMTEVIEELILTAPEAKIIVIFYKYENELHGIVYSDTSYSSKQLVKNYQPFGTSRVATFHIPGDNLMNECKKTLNEIKSQLN